VGAGGPKVNTATKGGERRTYRNLERKTVGCGFGERTASERFHFGIQLSTLVTKRTQCFEDWKPTLLLIDP